MVMPGTFGSMLAAGAMAVDAAVVMKVTESAMGMVSSKSKRKSKKSRSRKLNRIGNFSNLGI